VHAGKNKEIYIGLTEMNLKQDITIMQQALKMLSKVTPPNIVNNMGT